MFKKKILALLAVAMTGLFLVACKKNNTEEIVVKTPDDFEPIYYTEETEMPADSYYIVHKTKKGTRYYPLLTVNGNGTNEYSSSYLGESPTDIMWVNYNEDEGLIPTMHEDDKLIYKSNSMVPNTFVLRKYYDDGYTLGVAGLEMDTSGNYRYYTESSAVMPTSDATGFATLEADNIYLASIDGNQIVPKDVSTSGTIKGLELMKKYKCDIRTGTEKIDAELTCNIHLFSCAESYIFNKFTFITDYIAELDIPEYTTTGYYNLNGAGMFRYVKEDKSYKDLKESDYNKTIYEYDENGSIIGTKIGYVFDDNGCLVKDTTSNSFESSEQYFEETSNEYDTQGKNLPSEDEYNIITGTYKIDAIDSGNYADGTYYILDLTDPDKVYDDIKVRWYFKTNDGRQVPSSGETYIFNLQTSTRTEYSGLEVLSADIVNSN